MKTKLILLAALCVVTVTAQTNTPPVAPPDRVGDFITSISGALNGILGLLTVLLAWWGANGAKFKGISDVLTKVIKKSGSDELKKEIQLAAGKAGVEPALRKIVKALPPSEPAPTPAKGLTATTIVPILLCAVIAGFCGCSTFATKQIDERLTYDSNGQITEKSTTTTKAGSRTFFDSKSNLAKWKASQTEKSQSAEVGGLTQQSDGTNVVSLIEAITKGATRGALEFVKPVP